MALTIIEQLVLQMLQSNEVAGRAADVLTPPTPSGGTWTFGPVQFDVGGNAFGENLLANILLYALDANGSYVISPSNTTNRGTVLADGTVSITDPYIGAILDAAKTTNSAALSPADTTLVNQALQSAYG